MSNLDYEYMAKLVIEAQNSSSDAFAELYAATYQKQYSFAYKYLKDSYLAQDALQETYILALKNLNTLKEPSLFISWLNQICFRVCFNMQRKQNRVTDDLLQFDDDIINNLHTGKQTPEEHFMDNEQNKYIIKQVLALPLSESQAIILRYYDNLKIDDIAKFMNISKSTVKRHISNGLNRLKKHLEVYG